MNKTCWILSSLLLATQLMAGPVTAPVQSVLTQTEDKWGFSVRPEAKLTTFGGKTAGLAGLQLGPSVDRTFYFCLAGHTLISSVTTDEPRSVKMGFLDFWDAGLDLNWTVFSTSMIHGDLQCFIGGGRASYDYQHGGSDSANLFLVEPEADIMVNLTPTVEFGIGIGYRFANGAGKDDGMTDNDLSGVTGTLFLRWTEI